MTDQRFWPKVQAGEGDACSLWMASRDADGYGWFRLNGRLVRAHVAAWILANGPVPDGFCVLHRCDNPPCVRLSHLFLGTKADNTADMMAKGRGHRSIYLGTQNGSTKLTETNVHEIRCRLAAGETQAALARAFGVVQPTVCNIASGRTWAHLA